MTDSIDFNSIKQISGADVFYTRNLNDSSQAILTEDNFYTNDKYAPRSAQMGTIGILSNARDFPKLKMSGSIEVQMRQPLRGKNNKGGLRLGELESDTDIEYGINIFSREILMDVSDEY